MDRTTRTILFAGAAMLALAGAASGAQAQTTPPPTPTEVDEVLVTAQKRSESIQSVPAAISAIGAQALEERGIDSVDKLALQTPGLSVGRNGGVELISIRGVGVGIATGSVPAGVATHVDGVYQPRLTLGDLAQSDLARIELLRGPQGTLYGRNATAGVINYISAAPTDTFEGQVKVGYAEFNEARVQTVLSGPLNENLKGRVVVDYRNRQDGLTVNRYPGAGDFDALESLSGRVRLTWTPSDTFTVDFSAFGTKQSGPADVAVTLDNIRPYAAAFNPILVGANYSTRPNEVIADGPMDLDKQATGASVTATWDLGFGTLRSITSYSTYQKDEIHDADSTDVAFEVLSRSEESATWTQELNLSGKTGGLNWIVGAYYFNDDFDGNLLLDFPSGGNLGLGLSLQPGGGIENYYRDKTKAYAGFVDVTYEVTDRLRVLAGARYSVDQKDFTQTQQIRDALLVPPATPFPVPVPLIPACTNLNLDPKYSAFTPRLGVQYDVADSQNVYATFSKGYKSGGLNFSSCNNEFAPEKITSYEAGYKARLFNRMLTFNASIFHYDYRNQQIFQVLGATASVVNADEAKMTGADIDIMLQPDDHWAINAGVAVLKAEFGDFLTADPLDPTGTIQNLKGRRPPFTPELTVNLGVQYKTDVIDGVGRFTVRGEYFHTSDVYHREFNESFDIQKAYGIGSFSVIWDNPDDTLTLKAYANNLTDEAYTVTRFSAGLTGQMQGTWGSPRQIGVELIARF